MKQDLVHTYRINITGLVQGVGFRPFIYRKAHHAGLKGWVRNSTSGVEIRVNATESAISELAHVITMQAPKASLVESITIEPIQPEHFHEFSILKSEKGEGGITLVSPDIAVCDECLSDLKSQAHRLDYPFINCTNCGPRFSIIQRLPYDRPFTTMAPFRMCPVCKSEYEEVLDRRFHAQPVACLTCGPVYTFHLGSEELSDFPAILEKLVLLLEEGGIIAVKGVGGYHLMCDASNEETVQRLRSAKVREGKPFAVLFRDLETLQEYAAVSEEAQRIVSDWQRPILILPSRKMLATSVSNGFSTIGAMLPYTPFHYLLFEKLKLPALILTSGNLSDEPIVIDDSQAKEILGPLSDGLLIYNREIHNRNDDSVFMVAAEKPRILRRSRGFAPFPVKVKKDVEGILALGAELSNCFAVGRKDLVFLSQHIGDLKNFETFQFYRESIERYKVLFEVNTRLAVADLHPDYLSTQYALASGLPVMRVQHHHAHIASCMAEHGLDEPVIGVAFDGTGFGDDGTIWGGEFMVSDLHQYRRIYSLPLLALPGGDKATAEPWRIAVSILFQEFGNDFLKLRLPFLDKIHPERLRMVISALEKGINVPLSSSAGRWFDGIAALTGICLESGFHAEAPMRLEDQAWHAVSEYYPFEYSGQRLVLMPMVSLIVRDLLDGKSPGLVAAKFQNTMVRVIVESASIIAGDTGIQLVALSGGSFQNKFLLASAEKELNALGLKVISHQRIPTNDGGIALGQMVIAANTLNLK